MTKTPITYRETKLGVLEIKEIEKIVTDNLALVQKFIIRHQKGLEIRQETARKLHQLLAGNLFGEAGKYRKHNVALGDFESPSYFKVPMLMKDWEADLKTRIKHTKNKKQHIDNCAWLIHRFLWIHPFLTQCLGRL